MQLPLFEEEVIEPDHEALAGCLRASVVALDIETETRWQGLGPRIDFGLSYPADITVIALAWDEGDTVTTTALAAPFGASVCDFLNTLFAEDRWIVAHNAVFDLRQLSKLTNGKLPRKIWDTQSMGRLLHPAVNASYSLLGTATALAIPFSEQQQAMKSQRGKLHTLPISLTLAYAQEDAALALRIYHHQLTLVDDAELVDWECRATWEYCAMSVRGIRLNREFVDQRLSVLGEQRDELAKRLHADGLYNPTSGLARAKYLYEDKGIPLPVWSPDSWYFTRAGHRRLRQEPNAQVQLSDLSTRSDIIESYREDDSPYSEQLRNLSEYLEVEWLISALKGLIDHAALDGRLHSLITTATESGRRASSYPHMQNWKMLEMAGVAIGDDGFTLVEIDYRNAENVMAAFIAGDSALSAACLAEDFHSTMAAQYFGATWENADPAERKRLRTMAKKITFGTAYGMGAERLGASIDVTTQEAQRFIRAKDIAFANVTRTRNAAKQRAQQTGILKLWTGRKVAVPSAFVAWNFLCQGGVSEVLKRALVLIGEAYRAKGMRSRVALDMHDALILEVAHEEWDAAQEIASQIMISITPEHLNQRTNPPIRWVASPNLQENRNKWGATQWHPE